MAIKLAALAGVAVLACSQAVDAGGGTSGGPRLVPPANLVSAALFSGPAAFKYLPYLAGGWHGHYAPGQTQEPGGLWLVGGYHGDELPGQTNEPGGHKGVWLPGGFHGTYLPGDGVEGPWLPGGGHEGPWLPGGHKGT